MRYPELKNLSERLKYVRQTHNLSQAELAEKAGTTQQAIQQAEKGKARNPRYIHRLAHELDIPVEWMVFGKNEQESNHHKTKNNELQEKSHDVLDSFFSMPEKDQQLIYELMQSRKEK